MLIIISLNGKRRYVIKTIKIPKRGDKKYWIILEWAGKTNSFEKSLIASLNGWASPMTLTLFGPLRIWLYPRIFRSSKVTNATLTRIQIIKIKYLRAEIIYR